VTKRRIVINAILRTIRWLSWSGLALFSGVQINFLEHKLARGDTVGMATIEFALAEMFAAFCSAVAIDRGLSLAEKPFDEHD